MYSAVYCILSNCFLEICIHLGGVFVYHFPAPLTKLWYLQSETILIAEFLFINTNFRNWRFFILIRKNKVFLSFYNVLIIHNLRIRQTIYFILMKINFYIMIPECYTQSIFEIEISKLVFLLIFRPVNREISMNQQKK